MTNDKGIFIKNIYYMLTYAFQVLKQTNYEEIAGEEFSEIFDLFAAILAKGIAQQLKQGLYREYVKIQETLPVMRGKLEINGTIQHYVNRKHLLSCEYDELSENNVFNQILKTTAMRLIREDSVSLKYRQALKKTMVFFGEIDEIEPQCIRWNALRIQRNNRSYQMLMNVCYFVLDSLLQTTEQGKYKMAQFSDEHMHRLYERFILEYYKHHRKDLEVGAYKIDWALDDKKDEAAMKFLPNMQTDITLRKNGKTLIIDAKYYANSLQTHFNRQTVHSANLYQIFTYVKNEDKHNTGNVFGALLYAQTGHEGEMNFNYSIGGNSISVKTLDLNRDFSEIRMQLNELADSVFGT